jgi:hypothetical protein
VKVSVLTLVGEMVMDWSMAVAGIPPVQVHCAYRDD